MICNKTLSHFNMEVHHSVTLASCICFKYLSFKVFAVPISNELCLHGLYLLHWFPCYTSCALFL